jgi:rSAM/selenodomain-associated transferase 1
VTAARNRLALLVREPVPGRVKTRLAPALGEAGAANLYRAFLEDLAVAVAPGDDWDAVAVHDGLSPGACLRSIFRPPWSFRPQGDGSLGERLARAFTGLAAAGPGATIVAGSDVPSLGGAALRTAFGALRDFPGAVFAPSPDGGFSLVGLPWLAPPAFLEGRIQWSSEWALSDAAAQARSAGLETKLLGEIADVDDPGGLEVLAGYLLSHPAAAPATRAAFARVRRHPGAAGGGP